MPISHAFMPIPDPNPILPFVPVVLAPGQAAFFPAPVVRLRIDGTPEDEFEVRFHPQLHFDLWMVLNGGVDVLNQGAGITINNTGVHNITVTPFLW